MEVKVRKFMIPKATKFGVVEQDVKLDRVYVDGRHAGYVPSEGEYAGVFHPLVGFPNELIPEVLAACPDITNSLKAPALHKDEDLDDAT